MTGGFGYTLHAYGSKNAYVNNYLAVENIVYDSGPFLIGGGRPSHGIRVENNDLYNTSMQIGYTAPSNEDCDVRNNIIVNGGLSINKYKSVVNEGNLVLDRGAKRPEGVRTVILPSNYDPARAHVAIFDWDGRPEVEVDTRGFLKKGDDYRLLSPRDVFGPPVESATADGKPLRVPMKGEFAAFVLVKGL